MDMNTTHKEEASSQVLANVDIKTEQDADIDSSPMEVTDSECADSHKEDFECQIAT